MDYKNLKIGDSIPSLENPPITRTMLALYAGASGDHNPIHIDIDFAKKSGFSDVIAHGMLIMAIASKNLTNVFTQNSIKEISVKFVSMTKIGDELTSDCKIIEKDIIDNKVLFTLSLSVKDNFGDEKLKGKAKIELNE